MGELHFHFTCGMNKTSSNLQNLHSIKFSRFYNYKNGVILVGICLMIIVTGCIPNLTYDEPNSIENGFSLSENIQENNGFVNSRDKTRLFYRKWERNPEDNPEKKIIVVLPGIGVHSGFYIAVANYICPKNYIVYAMDYRGHGLSEGARGRLTTKATLMEDIDSIITFVKIQHSKQEIFLLGESMGALFALVYGSENPHNLAGLILIAPSLGANIEQLLSITTLLAPLYLILAPDQPVIDLSKNRLEVSSRDPQFKKYRREDPLALQEVSFRYLNTLNDMVNGWREKYPKNIVISTLIIQGLQDRVLSHQYAKELYHLIKSEDKELKLFPCAYHTLFFDPESPQVFEAIINWLGRH